MTVSSGPTTSLSVFDIAAQGLREACAERFDAGEAAARADTERLWTLAQRIVADVTAWAAAHRAMELARDDDFPPSGWTARMMEALFEEALTPAAARVLTAALDVACVNAPAHRGGPA